MTYEEALTKVLTAMGYVQIDGGPWWCIDTASHPYHNDVRISDAEDEGTIDANFIVQNILPWLTAQGYDWRAGGGGGLNFWVAVSAHSQHSAYRNAATFTEAVVMAIAEALE